MDFNGYVEKNAQLDIGKKIYEAERVNIEKIKAAMMNKGGGLSCKNAPAPFGILGFNLNELRAGAQFNTFETQGGCITAILPDAVDGNPDIFSATRFSTKTPNMEAPFVKIECVRTGRIEDNHLINFDAIRYSVQLNGDFRVLAEISEDGQLYLANNSVLSKVSQGEDFSLRSLIEQGLSSGYLSSQAAAIMAAFDEILSMSPDRVQPEVTPTELALTIASAKNSELAEQNSEYAKKIESAEKRASEAEKKAESAEKRAEKAESAKASAEDRASQEKQRADKAIEASRKFMDFVKTIVNDLKRSLFTRGAAKKIEGRMTELPGGDNSGPTM